RTYLHLQTCTFLRLSPHVSSSPSLLLFFFYSTSTTEIYTLSLHDALPILVFAVNDRPMQGTRGDYRVKMRHGVSRIRSGKRHTRSEEHTSELQSREKLVCRLLLEKKKQQRPGPGTRRPDGTLRRRRPGRGE